MSHVSQLRLVAPQDAGRNDIFALVLDGESFFLEAGGLPDVHGFIEKYGDQLRPILARQWSELLPGSDLPLVVNILINPHLLFCHRDSVRGQYRRYFRPVYLDEDAIRIDRGYSSDDVVARAIVDLHENFYKHYEWQLEGREFLSLNDIEAILQGNPPLPRNPLPPADTVISISRVSSDTSQANFEILANANDYWPQLKEALQNRQMGKTLHDGDTKPEDKFRRYLNQVTAHLGSYHHVTVGSDKNWVGRVYLAFRQGNSHPRSSEWIAAVKKFAFDVVAPLALAGTFVRNPRIIEMLGDLRQLLHETDRIGSRHRATIEQFPGSSARVNRMLVSVNDEITTTISTFKNGSSKRLSELHHHVTTSNHRCHCRREAETVMHAIEHCSDAGTAFLEDIFNLFSSNRNFSDVDAETVAFLAHSFAFGLTGFEERPASLKAYFKSRQIPAEWVRKCRTNTELSNVSAQLVPFIRALLVMVGNREMVLSDAKRVGIRVGEPELTIDVQAGGRILAVVKYDADGLLRETKAGKLEPLEPGLLHVNKARLLLHFGKSFFDDFQMCITTITGDKMHSAQYQWQDDTPGTQQTITYGFRFSL